MILERAGRLLARITRTAPPAAPPAAPPRRWAEDLDEAHVAADEWIAGRSAEGRLYVDVPQSRIEWLRERHAEQTRATIGAAERVLRHEFDLLGSGPYVPVDPERPVVGGYRPIDWYLDPVSGLRFPRGIPIASWNLERMRPGRADVKLPWELGRCQHWPMLGQA